MVMSVGKLLRKDIMVMMMSYKCCICGWDKEVSLMSGGWIDDNGMLEVVCVVCESWYENILVEILELWKERMK